MNAFLPADILFPQVDSMEKWAVIACDQFTSDPAYWERVRQHAEGSPSTINLILPEAELGTPQEAAHTALINRTMAEYLDANVFRTLKDSFVYVERTLENGSIRRGLIGMVDLDAYDYSTGSVSPIRATERTVVERIPPRMRVRREAPVELPHILMLADDAGRTLVEPVAAQKDRLPLLYEGELALGGGFVRGWAVEDPALIAQIENALTVLGSQEEFDKKYPDATRRDPLTLAVGDGNHSLASAKACWEEVKRGLTPQETVVHPARFAMVELENIHDDALRMEPIHRVLFGVDQKKFMDAFRAAYPNAYEGKGDGHTIEFVWNGESRFITVPDPKVQLAVGTLQGVIDQYLKDNGGEVDYIHGDDVTRELGGKPGNMGFLLPAMGKEQLFKTVMADGVLPRKTFSMGHAQDKRYYIEARKIVK